MEQLWHNSAFWTAHLISCFITGALSDRFGRKKVSFTLLLCLTAATSITPFATTIYMYIALQFISGFGTLNSGLDYVNMAENISKSKLSTIGITIQVVTSFCYSPYNMCIQQSNFFPKS